MTLKHDTEEQALEQSIIDNNLGKNTNEQAEIVSSMLQFLQDVQDTDSSDEYTRLVFDQLCLARRLVTQKNSKAAEDVKMDVRTAE